ncbi:MAG: N-acetylmuramoyl-L-alanine amidase [Candidatus Latescibacteria bacterium]|nr:N-acetylmuramoyl-L-alanine amidase [Candidatus Latescibacterota bacterium]
MNAKNIICLIILSSVLIGSLNAAPLIESISLSTIKDTTLLVFEVDTNVDITTSRISNSNLSMVFNAASAVTSLKPKGIIKKIDVKPETNATTFNLTLDKPYDFRRVNKTNTIMYKFYAVPVREIKTVVLDPGHGGIDPGAVGKKGTQEKEINLIIAKLLKKRLEDFGLKVYLTRSDDSFVALAERTRFANNKKADLFISIHCNASGTNKYASGFETYFLSEAKTDLERAALAREDGALRYETDIPDPIVQDELSLILADLKQTEQLRESYNLACQVQTSAVDILKDVDRGVKQAGFFVLRGCFMPAVLIECGFLSTLSEEKKLTNSKYRDSVARAIYLGIVNYIRDYEKRVEF